MSQIETIKSKVITEGLIIALVTSYIYLISFLYEYGYCSHFGIPKTFISPTITTLLISASSIGLLLFTSMNAIGFTIPIFKNAFSKERYNFHFRRFLLLNGILLVTIIILFFGYGFSLVGFLSFIGIAIFLNLFLFKINIKKDKTKLIEQRITSRFDMSNDPFDIWDPIEKIIGINGLNFVLFFIASLFLAYITGNSNATNESTFLTTKIDVDEYILIRKYNDLLILAPLNKDKRYVSEYFKIKNISSDGYISFRNEYLGKLKVIEPTEQNGNL